MGEYSILVHLCDRRLAHLQHVFLLVVPAGLLEQLAASTGARILSWPIRRAPFLLRRGCEASFFSGVLCVLSGGRLPEAIHGFSIGFPGCEAKARPGCFSCIHPSPTWLGGRSFISGM